MGPVTKEKSANRRLAWLACCGTLVLACVLVFHDVTGHALVNFDDPMYLTENGHVTPGLTTAGFAWAWTNKDTLQWQPLTWMGHQLVSEVAGMRPAAHLLANLLLHAVNAVLLYTVLRAMTGSNERSLLVALLFAVHPVNVETVAWASQLKSTLSTMFFLLALFAYARGEQRRISASLAANGALLLSLLAKPMMVSFPLVTALVDFWPLRRWPATRPTVQAWARWLGEKLPSVVLAGAIAGVTALPWGAHPEMATVREPGWTRLAAVPVNYVRYLGLIFWPTKLAVLYPENLAYRPWVLAAALGLLAAISVAAWRWRKTRPALGVGWGWFVVTLFPVSGIVRLGPQGIADRYLYVPAIGLFLAAVWLGCDLWAGRSRFVRRVLPGLAVVVLGLIAHRQVGYWRDSLTLWRHAAAVAAPSGVEHVNLGNALLGAGHEREAEAEFAAAIALQPADPRPLVELAILAQRHGDLARAETLLRQALARAPADARILSNLGSVLDDKGEPVEARAMLAQAVRLRPELAEAQINLGVVLAKAGEWLPAQACFEAASRLKPGDQVVRHNLELVRRQLAGADHGPAR